MKYLLLSSFVFLTFSFSALAQNRWCGHDEYRDFLEAENPGNTFLTLEARERFHRNLQENPSLGEARGGVRTIPVVFHVVYNTAAEDLSDALIQQQLDKLNMDFSTAYLSTQVSQFEAVAVNPMIQFCLASTNPQGTATTGITRTQTNVTSFSVGNDMKSSTTGGKDPWPFNSYYNVWICDIGFNPNQGGTAGFAYLPSYGPQFEDIDGAVMAYQVIGPNETTLSHETGHYLGLNHTWGVQFESCSDDDGFTDTPNCDGPNFGSFNNNYCPLTASSCGNLSNVENFMDYASCPTMFTAQQSAYMNSVLSTNYSQFSQAGRASLVTSNGCAGQQVAAPVADFVGSPTTVAVGANVTFTDLSTNSPTGWSWTFGDGGATSTAQNPVRSYSAPGQYTVTLTASNGTGSDSETKVNYITVTSGGGSSTSCDSLVYLDGEFIAQINSIDEANFVAQLIDNDQEPVNANLAVAGYDSGWLPFYEVIAPGDTNFFWGATSWHDNIAIAADNWITMGPITIPSDGADLSWLHSFSDMEYRDGYRVLLNYTGTDVLDFAGGTVLFSVADNAVSTAGDVAWASQSVNLSGATYAGQQVYIGFNHNALNMFVLYLDDIYMNGCNTTIVGLNEPESNTLEVYPNPSSENFSVRFENQSPTSNLTLFNSLGQQVWSKVVSTQGAISVTIETQTLSGGLYTLILNDETKSVSKKLVLNK